MTFLRATGTQWRTPYIGKSVIVSPWRGITRVQAWPRARGKPKTTAERKRLQIFSFVQRLIKRLSHHETDYARRAITKHNRTHAGQRGSAAIRLRDWQTKRLYGRGVAIQVSPQLTFWPAAMSRDASFILDHITEVHGSIAQRTQTTWEDIPAGKPGQVLTAAGPGQPNSWTATPK